MFRNSEQTAQNNSQPPTQNTTQSQTSQTFSLSMGPSDTGYSITAYGPIQVSEREPVSVQMNGSASQASNQSAIPRTSYTSMTSQSLPYQTSFFNNHVPVQNYQINMPQHNFGVTYPAPQHTTMHPGYFMDEINRLRNENAEFKMRAEELCGKLYVENSALAKKVEQLEKDLQQERIKTSDTMLNLETELYFKDQEIRSLTQKKAQVVQEHETLNKTTADVKTLNNTLKAKNDALTKRVSKLIEEIGCREYQHQEISRLNKELTSSNETINGLKGLAETQSKEIAELKKLLEMQNMKRQEEVKPEFSFNNPHISALVKVMKVQDVSEKQFETMREISRRKHDSSLSMSSLHFEDFAKHCSSIFAQSDKVDAYKARFEMAKNDPKKVIDDVIASIYMPNGDSAYLNALLLMIAHYTMANAMQDDYHFDVNETLLNEDLLLPLQKELVAHETELENLKKLKKSLQAETRSRKRKNDNSENSEIEEVNKLIAERVSVVKVMKDSIKNNNFNGTHTFTDAHKASLIYSLVLNQTQKIEFATKLQSIAKRFDQKQMIKAEEARRSRYSGTFFNSDKEEKATERATHTKKVRRSSGKS